MPKALRFTAFMLFVTVSLTLGTALASASQRPQAAAAVQVLCSTCWTAG